MNLPTDQEILLLEEFADVGVMSPERRLALGRLLEAWENVETDLGGALRHEGLMAAQIQDLRDASTLAEAEITRIRLHLEALDVILNKARRR